MRWEARDQVVAGRKRLDCANPLCHDQFPQFVLQSVVDWLSVGVVLVTESRRVWVTAPRAQSFGIGSPSTRATFSAPVQRRQLPNTSQHAFDLGFSVISVARGNDPSTAVWMCPP